MHHPIREEQNVFSVSASLTKTHKFDAHCSPFVGPPSEPLT
jgi:hypothetical protein